MILHNEKRHMSISRGFHCELSRSIWLVGEKNSEEMQATRNMVKHFFVISLHVFMSVFVFVFVLSWRNGSGWDGTAEVSQGLDRQPSVANHVPPR